MHVEARNLTLSGKQWTQRDYLHESHHIFDASFTLSVYTT